MPGTLATQDCGACPIRHRAVCAKCDGDELDRLQQMKSYRTWAPGETIALEGDTLPFVGTLVRGCATLTKSLEDGRVQMVGMLMPSDFVGRPGRSAAPYEVTAVTDTTLCLFERQGFERLIADTPHVSTRLLEMSLNELDAARDWMLLLGRKTARERVATLLGLVLRRAATQTAPLRAELPLGREAMASFLGLTIETVSRQISALRRDGVIEVAAGGRTILCPDFATLRLAAGDNDNAEQIFPD
ncbi:Crp/Fnr family transcriptional regulator [Salipiger sp. IMCC34102]|nr:Crp/Fnr family transcriptional regulator [Salipiger sp. IMCC34102]